MALLADGVVLQLVETDVPWQVVQPLLASLANVDYMPRVLQVRSELAPVDHVVAQAADAIDDAATQFEIPVVLV